MTASIQTSWKYVFLPVTYVNYVMPLYTMKFRLCYIPLISTPHSLQSKYTNQSNPKIEELRVHFQLHTHSATIQKSAWRLGRWGHYGAEVFIRQILWCGLKI